MSSLWEIRANGVPASLRRESRGQKAVCNPEICLEKKNMAVFSMNELSSKLSDWKFWIQSIYYYKIYLFIGAYLLCHVWILNSLNNKCSWFNHVNSPYLSALPWFVCYTQFMQIELDP